MILIQASRNKNALLASGAEKVEEVLAKNRGLLQLSRELPWLSEFLSEALQGRLKMNRSSQTKLECLSPEEAKGIGGSLAQALRQRKFAEAGMYQWKRQSPAMIELFVKYPFTESMMLTISQEVLKTAIWGLVWRAVTGAGLRMLHLVSDIYVAVLYLDDDDQREYGKMILTMICVCMFANVYVAFLQNRKQPSKLLVEIFYIFTGMKSGVDAMRVSSGKEQDTHQQFDPKIEMIVTKMSIMIFESIPGGREQFEAILRSPTCLTPHYPPPFPGCVLQVYAYMNLLKAGQHNSAAVMSIFLSALSTGFTSASISYVRFHPNP
jgi:hypothetical protein